MTAALDAILGPPSARERVTGELIQALGQYDYGPDHEDEIAYPDRHREATALLTRVAPLLIDHGREQAGRGLMESHAVRAWDGLADLLRWRDGWRVVFTDGQPWWGYRVEIGGVIDDHLTVAVGEFSHAAGDPTVPYCISVPGRDEAEVLALPALIRALPDLEAEVGDGQGEQGQADAAERVNAAQAG